MKQLKRLVVSFITNGMDYTDTEVLTSIVNKTILGLLANYCKQHKEFELPSTLTIEDIDALGRYNHRSDTIILSPSTANLCSDIVLDDYDSFEEKVDTYLHEHRHCAQYHRCEEFDELLDRDHIYMIPYNNKEEEWTYDAYINRPTEKDAVAIAYMYTIDAINYVMINILDALDKELGKLFEQYIFNLNK